MDGSLSHFKATLQRKKERAEAREGWRTQTGYGYAQHDKTSYNFPQLSDAELETVKNVIRQKIRAQQRRNYLIMGVAVVVISAILYFIF